MERKLFNCYGTLGFKVSHGEKFITYINASTSTGLADIQIHYDESVENWSGTTWHEGLKKDLIDPMQFSDKLHSCTVAGLDDKVFSMLETLIEY